MPPVGPIADKAAFLAAIRAAAPEDVAPRLVFADWLDDHDDSHPCPPCTGSGKASLHDSLRIDATTHYLPPIDGLCEACEGKGFTGNGYRVRAAFIRRECGPGRWDSASAEPAGEIRQTRPGAGVAAWWYATWRATIRAGMIEAVEMPWSGWRDHGDSILADHPVRDVTLTTDVTFQHLFVADEIDLHFLRDSRNGEPFPISIDLHLTLPGFERLPYCNLEAWKSLCRAARKPLLQREWPGVNFVLPGARAVSDHVWDELVKCLFECCRGLMKPAERVMDEAVRKVARKLRCPEHYVLIMLFDPWTAAELSRQPRTI